MLCGVTVAIAAEPSVLSKTAAALKPGQWAEIKAARPAGLMKVFVGYRPSGREKTHHIAGWTDDGQWDPRTRQFLYMGFRIQSKFIAYSEDRNQWRRIPGPFGWNTAQKGAFKDTRKTHFGHVYGRNALDSDGGIYYMVLDGFTYAYNLADGTWSRFRGGSHMSIEYFPGLGLMSHSTHPNGQKNGFRLSVLDPKTKTWRHFTDLPFSGYHAFARFNPIRDEMIFIAGNDNRSVVTMDREGHLTQLADLPFDMTIRHGKVVVDPNTGHYLIFHHKALYELHPDRNEYYKVSDFRAPWGKYEMPVPASITEHGVILFVDSKTLIYKHKPVVPKSD